MVSCSCRLTLHEYLRSHVLHPSSEQEKTEQGSNTHPRRPANLSQFVQLFLFHNPAQPKIGNHDISILCLGAEQQVFRFQI